MKTNKENIKTIRNTSLEIIRILGIEIKIVG
jgi:hypothetical protein